MDHLEEMDKFLKKYNFPKLNQEKQKILTDPLQVQKLKLFVCKQTKAQDQTASQMKLPKVYKIANTYPTQILPENCRGR